MERQEIPPRIASILVLFIIWVGILVTFAGREYHFLMKELKELRRLKTEYHGYIAKIKKIADNKNSAHHEYSNGFSPVNRSSSYLKKSAVDFGKKQGLGWALLKLYEANNWLSYAQNIKSIDETHKNEPIHKTVKKKILTEKNKKIIQATQPLKKEPRFSLPLGSARYKLSSLFGPRKKANGTWGFHKGLDMAAPEGTHIYAAAEGVISEAGWARGFGYTILITHSPTLKTRYAHLSKISVQVGEHVKEGQFIGNVGNTGHIRSKYKGGGHHLHFEVHLFGKPVNPYFFLKI